MEDSKSCLLISPLSFYSYSQLLAKQLEKEGFNVTLSNDEYPANVIGKIMGKLKFPLLGIITKKHICKRFLEGKHYDLAIIIKGRGMSESLIQKLKSHCTQVIGYTFDSFKYHPAPLKWFKALNEFYTFDYADARKHKLDVIELFSSLAPFSGASSPSYEISAIARNHSSRLKFIDSILSSLPHSSNFAFIYEQNIFTFIQNFLKNPILYVRYWKNISFTPLPYAKYEEVLRHSKFVIDFAHPSQSGITIRCFEALASGAKIFTNNKNVFNYKGFNETNTILVSSDQENLKEDYEKIQNLPVKTFNRSIETFVNQLIYNYTQKQNIPNTTDFFTRP